MLFGGYREWKISAIDDGEPVMHSKRGGCISCASVRVAFVDGAAWRCVTFVL